MRALVITILCGAFISASHYIVSPLDEMKSITAYHPLLWPFYLISLLNAPPRIFVARILWEELRAPHWLGHVVAVLYWPALGAFVGLFKHWALLGAAVLLVHALFIAVIFYLLWRDGIMF